MHEKFLLAALEQAMHGQGLCAPNPCVGAVAVQDGKIIAQAWHKGAGTPHAEQLLLEQLPPNIPRLQLYITLEPCNHWGRTPPCVDQIIKHGVEEVIFAFKDPNPLVAKNNSSEKLKKHGIKVQHSPIAAIDAFYKSYMHWMQTNKPRVTFKLAQTLDGKIAGANGERIQLSNSLCEQFTHKERAKTDVILTTSKTILADNPLLNARLSQTTISKPVAIIDSHCALGLGFNIFTTASYCLLYHLEGKTYPTKVSHSLFPMPLKNGKMDLLAVIEHLGGLGFHDVWVEAGSELFTAMHLEGLVNKTYLYIVPKILGKTALSAYQHSGLFDPAHTLSWHEMGDNMIACLDWQGD
ncbi:MAG: bifunctional diaminohydroxyphosphoribosylaminopyrimidine deaminase/5-amino-6-(5-phosphoribosylamino)uracil reductase RibD [Legionella sp.]|nr:bifunctional diaminohydroxyphosphoribosylaminopyrimidine deaminase/5-amino-6-(5-phosphoribosylamino)uracil reductase RibD [Legionella sp.]